MVVRLVRQSRVRRAYPAGMTRGTSTTRRRAVVAVGLVLSLLFVVGAVKAVQYRTAYGTFAWWDVPPRVTWCGRTYLGDDGPEVDRAGLQMIRGQLDGDAPYPIAQVGTVAGRPLLAAVVPEVRRTSGIPCAMQVAVQTGDDSYRTYTLSGGP